MTTALEESLLRKIKVLNELLWETRCEEPVIQSWKSNFTGEVLTEAQEQLHALYLLSHLTYFGLREVRELLKCMYRDFVRGPIIREIRAHNSGFRTVDDYAAPLATELLGTRFLGMGNPAESGTHLLYYFRQEAELSKKLFVHEHQLFTGDILNPKTTLHDPNLRRIVFIDDICGSGQQSVEYSKTLLPQIKTVASRSGQTIELVYLVLFGTTAGMHNARTNSAFDRVECAGEMDTSFLTYSSNSRVFATAPIEVPMIDSMAISQHYGAKIEPAQPLGYGNGQLLMAFHHNIPDNTLPILWSDGGTPPWKALLKRAHKIY